MSERENALHLLAHFNHFGLLEIRELLKSLYRDHIRYPLVQQIRTSNGMTVDPSVIEKNYRDELRSTRFVGMGNPSESGSHLLYYFRQENLLSKDLFVHPHEILDSPIGAPDAKIAISGLKRIVFIDDVLGSGQQAMDYSAKILPAFKKAAADEGTALEIIYGVLFAKPAGLAVARGASSEFDAVRAVHELDLSECAFSADSRVYAASPPGISLEAGRSLAEHYGGTLLPLHPLGYRDGQMLLGLHHNVPDNTLPIFWSERPDLNWKPIFTRHSKKA